MDAIKQVLKHILFAHRAANITSFNETNEKFKTNEKFEQRQMFSASKLQYLCRTVIMFAQLLNLVPPPDNSVGIYYAYRVYKKTPSNIDSL